MEVALHAEHKEVALAAFERLASELDVAQLRSVEVRSHQKAVSRRAKAMIQDIETAEAARHAAALERQRRESMLTDAVQQLTEVADVEVARADLARLSDSWAALNVTEPTSRERFAEAVRAVESAITRRVRENEEALERRRVRAEAIATREASACASRRSTATTFSSNWFRSKKSGDRSCRSSATARRLTDWQSDSPERSPRAGSGMR